MRLYKMLYLQATSVFEITWRG